MPGVGIRLNFDLPASCRNRWFETQPTYDLLNVGIHAMMCCHEGRHDDAFDALDIGAVQAAQRQSAPGEILQKKCANVRLILGSTGDRDQISDLDFR